MTESCGWWWPFEGLCILTERHTRLERDDRGRLHSATGPAAGYPDGWGVYAWHGVRVAEAVILRPESITVDAIRAEPNAEIRRVLLERFGVDRFVRDSGARPIHADHSGTLYRIELTDDEPLVLVAVVNATPEPGGSSKQYWLRVPPQMTRAREAVAWTFGLEGREYAPARET